MVKESMASALERSGSRRCRDPAAPADRPVAFELTKAVAF